MPNLLKTVSLLLLLSIMMALGSSSGLLAAFTSKTVSESAIPQKHEPKDLSGEYVGKIYFGDTTGDKYVMRGFATLVIKTSGKEFTLLETVMKKGKRVVVKEVSGTISTEMVGTVPAGTIQVQGDSQQIPIRWEIGPRKRLKIARQRGFARVFRFCTLDYIREGQCLKDL